ncbi:MAG: hypothetical protein Q4Q58_04580 [Thermoplasmata archaeon]|nr:hypothetical protein [Thermoplasmata archaeon]
MYKMYGEEDEDDGLVEAIMQDQRAILQEWRQTLVTRMDEAGIIMVKRAEYEKMRAFAEDHGYVPESSDIVTRLEISLRKEKPRPWENFIAKNGDSL